MILNWLKDTTQAYRRGYVEGEEGHENVFLLHAGLTNPAEIAEYERGFYDALAADALEDVEIDLAEGGRAEMTRPALNIQTIWRRLVLVGGGALALLLVGTEWK